MSLAEMLCFASIKDFSEQDVKEISGIIDKEGSSGFLKFVKEAKLIAENNEKTRATEIIERCYNLILKRDLDEAGLELYQNDVASGKVDAISIIKDLLLSEEFRGMAFSHPRIAEAAVKILIPVMTGKEPSETSVKFLGERMTNSMQA